MRSKHILSIKHVSKTFYHVTQPVEALHTVSLTVSQGELVSLVGPSGCGKTTILDIVAGLTSADSGEVFLDEKPIVRGKASASYMMQDDNLLPWRTILDNLILPLELVGTQKTIARQEGSVLLKQFGLSSFALHYPVSLSGGMRQRIALLRTYLCKKDMMLLDEPFGRLDAITKRQLQEWFLTVRKKTKKSVIFVTHDVDEAIFLSDRIYVFSKRPGRIIGEFHIPLPRPRTSAFLIEKRCIEIKKAILQLLQ